MSKEDLVGRLKNRLGKLKSDRSNWDTHWDEVAQFIIPKKDDIFGARVRGEKKHNRLFDSTSIHSNELLASALQGMLTNPTSVWFGLSTGDLELDQKSEVRAWLDKVVQIILQTLNNSNFQTEIHEIYLDLGSFGTGLLRIEDDEKDIIRFHSRPIYEAWVAENSRGIVDTVYREYEWTVSQVLQEFGKKALNEDLRKELETDPLKRFTLVHAIEPRAKLDPNKLGPKNMPFASYHFIPTMDHMLRESGFNENPYVVPRWSKLSAETYGRSPGMKALSDIKMLNEMMKTTIEQAQLVVSPPLQVPDDGVLLPIRTNPKSINYYRAGTKDRIEPLLTGGRIDLGEQMMESVRARIRQAFFIDQLQLNEGPQMTATEVLQRTEEKLRLMGPLLGRQNHELLKPMIDRVFNVLIRKNKLPPAPREISGANLEVFYTSQIAKAQKASEAVSFQRMMEAISPVAELQPEMLDIIDGDGVLKMMRNVFGVPQMAFKDDTEVQAIRKQRAEAQKKQAEAEQGAQQAETAKNVAPLVAAAEGT